MQRTTAPNNVASKPAYASGGESPGYYTDETTGGSGTPGTLVSAADMNLMQEEIANAIEDIGGLTLDSADDAHLRRMPDDPAAFASAVNSASIPYPR